MLLLRFFKGCPMRIHCGFTLALLAWGLALTASSASAEVTRWEITSRTPYADGREFGSVGAYERIVGKVHYAVDPAA